MFTTSEQRMSAYNKRVDEYAAWWKEITIKYNGDPSRSRLDEAEATRLNYFVTAFSFANEVLGLRTEEVDHIWKRVGVDPPRF